MSLAILSLGCTSRPPASADEETSGGGEVDPPSTSGGVVGGTFGSSDGAGTAATAETGAAETSAAETTGGAVTTNGDGPGSTGEATGTTGEPPAECPYAPVPGAPPLSLELVGQGFDRPLLALGHPTEPERLFVVEQGGNVRILEPGQLQAPSEAFLHVDVEGAGLDFIGPEYGLLGFAFHPDFPADPRVYVNYNPFDVTMRTVVSEFTLDPEDPDRVDEDSERIILALHQPENNHNGGMLVFDAAGYLLVGMGDGGGANDVYDTGRNPAVLQSKLLRIGVEPDGIEDDPVSCVGCPQLGPFDYTIPPDNPFVGDPVFAPEIYAWGLRNPWRFARDPATDRLYIGDVGQWQWEEITLAAPGADLGWSAMEGFHCFGGGPCDMNAGPNEVNEDGITMPLVQYHHDMGRCSVTGGAVYRSCEVPAWQGTYLYGDFCTGELFGLVWDGSTVTDLGMLLDHGELLLGNGWNARGDVFFTTVDAILGGPIFDGLVYRVVPGS